MTLHAIAISGLLGNTYTFYGEQLDDDSIFPKYVVPFSDDPAGYLGAATLPETGYKRWQPLGADNTLSLNVDGSVYVHGDESIYSPDTSLSFDEADARRAIREDYASTLVAYHAGVECIIESGTHIVGMRMPVLPNEVVFTGELINIIFGVPHMSLSELRAFL